MKLRQLPLIVCLLLSFSIIWYVQDLLLNQKAECKISATSPFEGLRPGDFAGTVLLGGFRNIVIDISWMKAIKLKEEQEYYKLFAAYKAIATLQPNVPVVWEFNSSNMIYNLSAEAVTIEEQDRWIRRGIDFLKEGIEKNPNTYRLYAILGFVYMNKIFPDEQLRKRFIDAGTHPMEEALYYLNKACEQEDATIPTYSQRIHVLVSLWRFDEAQQRMNELIDLAPDWISLGAVFENRFQDYRYEESIPYMRNKKIYDSWKEMK